MEIYCSTQFEGFHSWDGAPDEVAFLRDRHRHTFHVTLWMEVDHDDRDVEFILLKRELEAYIADELQDENYSCEQYARAIRDEFEARYDNRCRVEVSEDGENGAVTARYTDR